MCGLLRYLQLQYWKLFDNWTLSTYRFWVLIRYLEYYLNWSELSWWNILWIGMSKCFMFFYYYMDMSWNCIWILMDSQNLKMVQKLISNMWIISGCYIVIFCCISVSVYGTTVLLEGEWCKVLQMDTWIYHCYDNIFYGGKGKHMG